MPMEAMSYTLTITQEADYLHALVTGSNSKENVAAYLEELRRECYARNSFRVLIEERLEGPRLRTMEVYQIVSEGGLSQVRIDAMAYVAVNAEGDLMKFAETLAVNRGLPVRLFSSVANARKWLSQEAD